MGQHEALLAWKPFHMEVRPYIHVVFFLQVVRFIELGEKSFFSLSNRSTRLIA